LDEEEEILLNDVNNDDLVEVKGTDGKDIKKEDSFVKEKVGFSQEFDPSNKIGKEVEDIVEYDFSKDSSDDSDDIVDLKQAMTDLDYQENTEYRNFVEASMTYDDMMEDRQVMEIIIMAGVALTALIILFGTVSLATSLLRARTVAHHIPPQMQINTSSSGSIIKQYRRLPVEVRNMLPSNVAYHQLYET